jgi:hypothetical protein
MTAKAAAALLEAGVKPAHCVQLLGGVPTGMASGESQSRERFLAGNQSGGSKSGGGQSGSGKGQDVKTGRGGRGGKGGKGSRDDKGGTSSDKADEAIEGMEIWVSGVTSTLLRRHARRLTARKVGRCGLNR